VYKQSAKHSFDSTPKIENNTVVNRRSFSAKKFAADHSFLTLVAANFYQAEWDEYVPVLRKQLGLE
jgi:hypothetical protein